MTVLSSLKNRAGMLIGGGLSFLVVIGVMRASAGEPLVQPQADVGVLIGIALVTLYFVITDTRGSKA